MFSANLQVLSKNVSSKYHPSDSKGSVSHLVPVTGPRIVK